jgi:hypothetical protein
MDQDGIEGNGTHGTGLIEWGRKGGDQANEQNRLLPQKECSKHAFIQIQLFSGSFGISIVRE